MADYDPEMHRETKRSAKVFISCGQVTEAEKNLGSAVSGLIHELTPYEPYFAQNQSNLEGLTKNILEALNDSVGLVAIMHPRGKVISLGSRQHTRGSIWIEQEIAIAAFITQVLKKEVRVAAYIHRDVEREGMREQLHLNAYPFIRDDEVLVHLRRVLPEWVDLGRPRELQPAPWEPDARIENANHGNFLILKSDREFRLHRVSVMGPSGAILQELPKSPEWDQVRSRGYRQPIPNEALTKAWDTLGGPREGRADASIGYEVSAADQRLKRSLPVVLTQEFYNEGSAFTAWTKVTG